MQDLSKESQRGNDEGIRVPGGAEACLAVLECSNLRTTERWLVVALTAYII